MKPQPERKGPHPAIPFGFIAIIGAVAAALISGLTDPWAIGAGIVGAALLIYGSTK